MYKILICDDERDIRNALRIYLTGEGYAVCEADSGLAALELMQREEVQLVLMDIMMPGMDGMTATAKLREQSNVPVILITAKSEDNDKILGLTVGADDYITKPFNPLEVLARVKAQLRRYAQLGGMPEKSTALTLGGIAMDDERKSVTLDGEEVTLTPTEYDILRLLLENPGKVFKRILAYVMSRYKAQVIVVLCCILLAVFAQLQGVMFSQTLIDSYILPLLKAGSTDFSGLAAAILRVAVIYCVGIAAVFVQNRLMARITQGTLKDLRDEMFTHMQTLPIKYFDTHAHGDIMSVYTNDIDTLRQMISQSLPQLVNTVVTLVGVLASMLYLSVPLTVLALAMVGVMLLATKYLTGNSGKYFIKQQQELGKVNGYIEEMMNGQKVIKVFCHEEIAIEEFDRLNDELFHSADKANSYSLVAMPVNGQLGNLSYVFCAILGGALAINGFGGFTLGGLASFLVLTRQFNQPISQISMQLNSVVMALAGGARIFALLDEKPEVNEGDITLVHAKYEADDTVTETNESTGMWAWKRMDADGKPRYTKLEGDIVFKDVDFGYDENKLVLRSITME